MGRDPSGVQGLVTMQVSDNMVFPLGLQHDRHTWLRASVVVQLAIGQASLAFGCDWRP
ncbi:hypothetical protein RB6155 [Rhodopirellula baltica SH 1]|uniref:Uncharacterized protein n=1 Tax=Rhodopirellula baltica (strain DSM 10527 / NCIMB 13988 / SH1) TaxID=243090 RepID=Q7UQQ9_RHOBA|nr:hypothetical protein RB6155 [Rhodopirellula baltica SH 1]